jgi:hypothetical protein
MMQDTPLEWWLHKLQAGVGGRAPRGGVHIGVTKVNPFPVGQECWISGKCKYKEW